MFGIRKTSGAAPRHMKDSGPWQSHTSDCRNPDVLFQVYEYLDPNIEFVYSKTEK